MKKMKKEEVEDILDILYRIKWVVEEELKSDSSDNTSNPALKRIWNHVNENLRQIGA